MAKTDKTGTLSPHHGSAERAVLLGILLQAAVSMVACSQGSPPSQPRPAVPVKISIAVRKDIPIRMRAIGNVEAYTTVSVKAQADGELTGVLFTEGQAVRKGDLLFTIDPRPFEAELRRAEANLARNQALQKQAEANLSRDLAQLEHARVESRRYERLIQAGVVPREQYDQVRTNEEALEASVRADRAAIENAEEAIRADRAAVENARIRLGYCSIRSPINGRTGSLMVHAGNVVKSNDTNLVVINQVTPIHVNFSVPERHLADIKRYLSAGKLQVSASIPDDGGEPDLGLITFVDNAVDRSTGTIRLKGTFANGKTRLWPGQFVNVDLNLASRPDAVVVPSQAVQRGQSGLFIYVVRQDSTVESRPVVVGVTVEGETVIESGVDAGDQVVVDGQLRLVPGARVEVKSSGEADKDSNS